MNRLSILLVTLLALVVVACSSNEASPSPSEPAATPEPTATPSAEPTATAEPSASLDPASSDQASGDGTALVDLLPDELDGMTLTEVEGLDSLLGPMLAQQGVDAAEADFAFASYGEGTDAVYVNALRIPGMTEVQLEMLAQMMSGSQTGGEVDAEPVTIGGKDVLRMGGADVPAAAYLYFSNGAVFTVISESEDLAAMLLEQLP